ncbi:thioredoxin-like protein [Blakeslea trispora]|nr:thioredoxin-like protein [Blakeslea trispora]
MKYFWVLLTVWIAVTQAALVQLTDDNFSELVTKQDEWVIDFYADWCSYCKKAAPRIEAAERLLSLSSHKHVKVGLVNVETSPALAARFLISRLPTVVHIKDHEGKHVYIYKQDKHTKKKTQERVC